MTKLSAIGARAPVRAHHLCTEDRSIYRRWARRVCAAYVIIIGLLAVGLSLHDRPASQLASRDQGSGAGRVMTTAPQVAGRISRRD